MKKVRSTKRALLVSALALLTCVSMLVGSTFAWFTDSVTSAGNIIKSGTLEVAMDWADGTKAVPAVDSAEWTDASTGAIFNYDLWEPGYTVVRHIKIANEGTLALKYQLNILPTGEVSKLADVIDVYYVDPAVQIADRDSLSDANKIGTLTQVLAAVSDTASGSLKAGENHTITLALKMQESAGNEYQDLSIGSAFSVQLLATQLAYEEDSFNNQYDVNAGYTATVATAEELGAALLGGGQVKLANDIDTTEALTIPEGVSVILDLNGKTLTTSAGLVNKGTATIQNGTIANNVTNSKANVVNNAGTMVLDGATIQGAPMDASGYPAYTVYTTGKLTVEEGTTISADRGAISMGGNADVVINGGSFTVSNAADGRNMTLHTIYAYSYNAKLTINDGYFEMNHTSTGGASVICPAGATINIYGGVFKDAMDDSNWKSTGNFQNYMGYGAPVNVYGGNFDDATVNKNLAADHITLANADGTYTVLKGVKASSQDALADALSSNAENVVLSAGTYQFPSLPAGTTIIGQEDGVVFNNTLSGTLDNVTLKNVHIKAGNAQRWAYSHGDLVFEDCTFEATSIYAIHYDGLNGANIVYKNCTIIGWAAIGSGAEHITFDGCKIYGNGTYGVLRLYSPATIKNCTFDVSAVNTTDAYQDGIHAVDCEIKVSGNTNVNGAMDAIYNVSGTGVITEE